MFLFQRPNGQDPDCGRRGQDSLHETASQQGGSSMQLLASRIRICKTSVLDPDSCPGCLSNFRKNCRIFFLKQTSFACQYLNGKHSSFQIWSMVLKVGTYLRLLRNVFQWTQKYQVGSGPDLEFGCRIRGFGSVRSIYVSWQYCFFIIGFLVWLLSGSAPLYAVAQQIIEPVTYRI